jgi:hypothetical protein
MGSESLYIFCLAKNDTEETLDIKGIEDKPVYALTHNGFAAVAQECEAKPYNCEDQNILANWLFIHQNIVDFAWEKYQTIIPFSFDTIIVSIDGKSARQNLNEWLEKEAIELERKLENLKNKAEYGVQILWDPMIILPGIKEQDLEIQNLEKEIGTKTAGVSYLLQKKLEELIRQRLEKSADEYFKEFYTQIRENVENIRVEKIRKEEPPKKMILNLSCLLNKGETNSLGSVLEKIGSRQGFDVRFTGPWPPYSFVNT